MSYDPRSYERNSFCNCGWKPEKFRTSTGFEPIEVLNFSGFHPQLQKKKNCVRNCEDHSSFDKSILLLIFFKDEAMYVSMLPTEALHVRVLTGLMLEFEESRFACITTESSRNDSFFSHLSQYLSSNAPHGTSTQCIILNTLISIEEFSAHLEDIHVSSVRVIVVHSSSDESSKILSLLETLNMKILHHDFVWVFTDKAVGAEARHFPKGSIGMLKTQETGNDRMLKMYEALLNDSVKLFAHALKHSVEELSHSANLKSLREHRFVAFKRRLYRYVSCSKHCIWNIIITQFHLKTQTSNEMIYKIKKRNKTLPRSKICYHYPLTSAIWFFRQIINQSFLGKTGPVQFCSRGGRISFEFTIVKAQLTSEGGLHWRVMGHDYPEMTHDTRPHIFEPLLLKVLPRSRHLRIVSVDHDPFTVIHSVDYSSRLGASCPFGTVPCVKYISSDQNLLGAQNEAKATKANSKIRRCCYGAMIDILIKLQELEEFTFDLYLVADGKYGSLDPDTNQMNGMIGDVYRGSADLALGLITMTEQRSAYVEFTTPYMGTALTFLVKKTNSKIKTFAESISDTRLMRSFSTDLWLMCLATFFVVVMSVWLIEKLYYYRNRKSSCLLPFEFIMYVYGNTLHVPLTNIQAKSVSVSFVMLVANFAGLVLVSSYTANLLASLITVDEGQVVSGIGDIKASSMQVKYDSRQILHFKNEWGVGRAHHTSLSGIVTRDMGHGL